MIRLYIKIPDEFVCLIHRDRFCVVHIPFVRMVKFKFLAPFLVDHLIIIIIIISSSSSSSKYTKFSLVVVSGQNYQQFSGTRTNE